jgi:hypothetical protein
MEGGGGVSAKKAPFFKFKLLTVVKLNYFHSKFTTLLLLIALTTGVVLLQRRVGQLRP